MCECFVLDHVLKLCAVGNVNWDIPPEEFKNIRSGELSLVWPVVGV